MITREEFRKQALQLSKILNSRKVHQLVHPFYRFELEETLYHVANAPDETPYTTYLGVTFKGKAGALHTMFQEGTGLIYLSQPHPQAGHDPLYTTDLRAVVRRATEILARATKVEIHGNVTGGLWDGVFRPLNSSNLRFWAQPQDHQQPGPDAGDEIDMLEL